ncbi:hypothetical protein ACJMK2_012222 [Sinanodonta woodiana]|uniref:Uncharacterized protein n=2 Tax=Sinanodonta woodiana TaxID=1069815 RepID=A0ABD3VAM1_SINWO
MANLLDLDDDEMFGNPTISSADNIDTQYHGHLSPITSDGQAQTFDDFFGVTSDEGNNNQGTSHEDDPFGISSDAHGNMANSDLDLFISGSNNANSTAECSEEQSSLLDDIFDSFMHVNNNQSIGKAEHSNSSDDLVDLNPFLASSRDTNPEKADTAAVPTGTYIFDDDFESPTVSTPASTFETPKPEPVVTGHKMEDRSHGAREKNLGVKKSLISSQERTHHVMPFEKVSKPDVKNWFEAPPIPAGGPPEMDNVKDVAVEDEDTWEVVNQVENAKDEKWEEEEEEENVEEERVDTPAADMVNAERDYLRHGDSETESETCIKTQIERQESETSQRSNTSSGQTEGDEANRSMDLDAVQDTSHLDVDVTKQKTSLRKRGSLAKRRKPSRQGRRSIIEEGEHMLFQDTTEPRPEKDEEEEEEEEEGEDHDGVFAKEDMSPPHKKPTPPALIPGTTLPVQQESSMEQNSPTDSKAVKPPTGGVKLPAITPNQLKRSSKDSKEEITSPVNPLHSPMKVLPPERVAQSSDFIFDLPKLRKASVDNDEDSTHAEKHVYEKPSLRSIPKVEGESKTKEEDGLFSKPQLKSAPKVNSDSMSDEVSNEKILNKGVFKKPSLKRADVDTKTEDNKAPSTGEFDVLKLRQTPRKGSENVEKINSGLLESPVLRPATKPTEASKMDDSDSHLFDKPALRNTPRKNVETKPSEPDQHIFTKPELRNVNKTKTSDVRPDQDVHTFEKPSLRGTPPRTTKADELPTGKFEKPALRSVSRSSVTPEKEKLGTAKSGFEKPALKPVDAMHKDPHDMEKNGSVEEGEEYKPSWLINLRKTGSPSVEDNEKTRLSEPEWLQAAKIKKAKVLEIIQSKENQNHEVEKPAAPWVESNVLRKTPKSSPLQENNINGENRQSFSTGQERHLSSGSSKDSDHIDARSRSPSVGTGKDNYVPSWMKGHSPGVTPPRINPGSKPDLLKRPTDEPPQWRKELAEKRKQKKESEGLDLAVRNDETDSPGVPHWKQELSQRGLRAAQKAKATPETSPSSEPEWKLKAEEKKERLRSRVQ